MGSIATTTEGLEKELKELEKLFWVSTDKLKSITKRFQEELEEGLEANGKNISMNVTWVQGWPTGHERGSYLTVDLGGTNIRVCWITLTERHGDINIAQHEYKLPEELKTGDADALWSYVAESVQTFIHDQGLGTEENTPLPLGFTFSYPAIQDRLDHAVLQTWTKGFDIKGVEGEDVAHQFRQAMEKRKIPVKLVAVVNDTIGAMIASSYNDDETIIGAIFGTGCNGAYMEDCGSIAKVTGQSSDTPMAINCEYGAFDNSHQILPRTRYDDIVDEESPRPGEQTFEKMSAGLYLGEILRLAMVELHQKGAIFKDNDISMLQKPYCIDTGFLSAVENDKSAKLLQTKKLFQDDLGVVPTEAELLFIQRLAGFIAVRGSRLCACGVAAICRKKNMTKGHVAADGSVANKHPTFKVRWAKALGEILDWPDDREEDPITLTSAEDGSGIGAAVIVAMALEKGWK